MTTKTNPFPARIDDYDNPEFQTIPEYIRQTVTQAVGLGSTCWENLEGTGVFDDVEARRAAESAVERIMEQIDPGEVVDLVSRGIRVLVEQSGTNSRDHGFHDDEPVRADFVAGERGDTAFANAIRNFWISKLALMHEEASEMLGELRDGRDLDEVYYRDKATGKIFATQMYGGPNQDIPMLKPEGFGIELADLVIRSSDLAYMTNLPLDELIAIKHEYNKTRPYKHGRML